MASTRRYSRKDGETWRRIVLDIRRTMITLTADRYEDQSEMFSEGVEIKMLDETH